MRGYFGDWAGDFEHILCYRAAENLEGMHRGTPNRRVCSDTYLIYYDKCMEQFASLVTDKYLGAKIETGYDEHYQCHKCNKKYVL